MIKAPRAWQRFSSRLLGGLAVPFLLHPTSVIHGADNPVNGAGGPPAITQSNVPTLTLADCLRIAMDKQPALAASRASLASAQTNQQALDSFRAPTFIVRELPIRRKQACLGVAVAAGKLEQAEHETIYAVTRTYFSVLYAREQKEVTARVVREVGDTLANARKLVEGGAKKPTQNDVDKLRTVLGLAEMRQAEASAGVDRATAALREAMGGEDWPFIVAPGRLPASSVKVDREEIIGLALARRGEMTQAVNGAEAIALEADAQATSLFRPQFHTFASFADIHYDPIPQGTSDGDYRPGAIGPEMPTNLFGHRKYRIERANDLGARASAVVDKTRNLIALEAEDGYWKWQDAALRVTKGADAVKSGDELVKRTREGNRDLGEDAVSTKEVLDTVILSAQASALNNEARFRLALALAALERITAGGFNSGLACRPGN